MAEFIFLGIFSAIILYYELYYEDDVIKKKEFFPKFSKEINTEGFSEKHFIENLKSVLIKKFKKYNDEIKKLESEIELLPSDEQFKEFKELKEKTLQALKNKMKLDLMDYVMKIRKKIPTFVVVKSNSYPVTSKKIVKYYQNLSKELFGNSNVVFMNNKTFKYIIYTLHNNVEMFPEFFHNFFKVIDVKNAIVKDYTLKTQYFELKEIE